MRRRNSRGQSLVESAIVLAAFMGLVVGIADVGQLLFARQTLAARVNDAARWGAMHPYDPRAISNVVLYGTAQPASDATAVLGLKSDAVQIANPGCPGVECRIMVAIPGHNVRSVEPAE